MFKQSNDTYSAYTTHLVFLNCNQTRLSKDPNCEKVKPVDPRLVVLCSLVVSLIKASNVGEPGNRLRRAGIDFGENREVLVVVVGRKDPAVALVKLLRKVAVSTPGSYSEVAEHTH